MHNNLDFQSIFNLSKVVCGYSVAQIKRPFDLSRRKAKNV